MKSAKNVKKTQNRYAPEWTLRCLLLYIKSPTTYKILRQLNILPLPCKSTILRYLKLSHSLGNFDARHLAMFERKLKLLMLRDPRYQYGLLCIDEMHVREALQLDTSTNSFTGIVDFEYEVSTKAMEKVFPSGKYSRMQQVDDDESTSSEREPEDPVQKTHVTGGKANNALVFMFSSLCGDFSQPIAIFPSEGPTNAKILGQMLVLAILKIEEAGGRVLAVVGDGASTNKKMFRDMEVEGKYDSKYEEDKSIFMTLVWGTLLIFQRTPKNTGFKILMMITGTFM